VLTLTENASQAVKAIVEQTVQGDQAGLRISQDAPDSAALNLVPAEAPQPGDQLLEQQPGARLYLDETAATTLDDKVLDAAVDENGGVEFRIGLQQA
jgi:Fe-S cluster assembly iron-binding protein IscA